MRLGMMPGGVVERAGPTPAGGAAVAVIVTGPSAGRTR